MPIVSTTNTAAAKRTPSGVFARRHPHSRMAALRN
jgi:hypothetical protein